ncbi:MAG: hypothetical protein H6745_25745 [Deltaproteobacteria bacterium]|nr:hypothetical protein [Deltaproteobacteria bacterium]
MGASLMQRDTVAVPATPRAASEAGPEGARSPAWAGMQGLPFAAQEQRLAPSGAAPVQREAVGAGKAPAPTPKDAGAPDAQEAPAERAGATTPLSEQQVVQAMAMYRKEPLPSEVISAIQEKLRLAPTGVIDPVLVQAVAASRGAGGDGDQAQAGKPKRRTKKQIAADEAKKARSGVPNAALAQSLGIAVDAKKVDLKVAKGAAKLKGPAPAQDAGCQKVYGVPYAQYVASLVSGTFLGLPVTVHPQMLQRLQMAEAFLHGKTPDANGNATELRKRLGVTNVSSLRLSSAKSDQMYHGIGFAIDLNPGTNPWVFGNTGRSTQNKALPVVLERASAFTGSGAGALTASKISALAQKMSTMELIAKLESVDASLEAYRKFGKLPKEELEKVVDEKLAANPKVKALGNKAFWMKKVPFDDLIMGKYIEDQAKNDGVENTTGGFMDLKPVVIQAMRDAAGLRWGATDMGAESGDMMHFDGHNTLAKGTTLRAQISAAAARLAAGAEEKAGDAKDADAPAKG